MTPPETPDELAAVIAEHWMFGLAPEDDGWDCSCGERLSDAVDGVIDEVMIAHVAEQIRAHLAGTLDAAKADALRPASSVEVALAQDWWSRITHERQVALHRSDIRAGDSR